MIADYCEALIHAKMGKGLLTIFEECQDFVPLQKRNPATAPIIRLCKLGRALGYGVCMVTQRPAAITKEALSQASTYIIHNVMQTRDLIAIKDQISYGTDKERIDKLVDGIAFAQSGECIIYSPEFLKDDGFLWIGKISMNLPRFYSFCVLNICRLHMQDLLCCHILRRFSCNSSYCS